MNKSKRMKLIGGALVVAGAMLVQTAPAWAQDPRNPVDYNDVQPGNLDDLVSRIALYPDPLLAQIFAAAAFPDQIVATAQGSGGPFDASVEVLRQYPSVLQMMASDPAWTQALGEAVMQDEGSVMDVIQKLRREAQQYGYLQTGPQMQVADDGGYINIEPAGDYMYVPVYDPYVVFARPRAGFFAGGAIRFGSGFRWVSGSNRFDWRRHEVFVNRRVWTPPVRRTYAPSQRAFRGGDRESNRNYTAPAVQAPGQRSFTSNPARREFAPRVEQRNLTAQPPREQRTITAPRQMEPRNFTPQPRNQAGSGRGTEGRRRDR